MGADNDHETRIMNSGIVSDSQIYRTSVQRVGSFTHSGSAAVDNEESFEKLLDAKSTANDDGGATTSSDAAQPTKLAKIKAARR